MKKIASLMVGLLLCGCTAFANEAAPVVEKTAAVTQMYSNVLSFKKHKKMRKPYNT